MLVVPRNILSDAIDFEDCELQCVVKIWNSDGPNFEENVLHKSVKCGKVFYHINCGIIQVFPALKKAVTTHVIKISYFFTCVDIANQLLTRHLPLAPLGQVD